MELVANSNVRAQVAPANPAQVTETTDELIEAGILRGDEPCDCGETTVEECNDCCGPAASPQPANPAQVTEAQIEHMVQQFLRWKLPDDFNPDGGISFTKISNVGTSYEYRHEPVGTNLFDYMQTKAMVRHMLEGLPAIGAGGQSYAQIVEPYAAAQRMIRDAIQELFGPIASLESEDATLLRGPEPHHEAEAQIDALMRVRNRIGAGGQAVAVAVKPLEWREEDEDGWWSALPMTGLPYEVRRTDRGNVRVRVPDNGEWCPFDGTVSEAKAAAQADFERHILSVLSHPHPADERVVEALKWYAVQVAGCRKVTSEGNDARTALNNDGEKRALAALSAKEGQ